MRREPPGQLSGFFGALLWGAVCFVLLACSAQAQDGWSYQGRTVTISVAGSPGGGYDLFARLLARHLPRHLPGNPSVIVKNMPGAGGLVLANYLQTVARILQPLYAAGQAHANYVPGGRLFGTHALP